MFKGRQALMMVAWGVLIVLGLGAGLAVHRLWKFRSELERLADRLTLDVGPESTLIYDNGNNLVSALFEEHRIAVRLEEMSQYLVNAVLATEDQRFFDHDGVDVRRIIAAAVANQQAGEIKEGGSTITQQLVRSILLDRSRNYTRKIKEAILARRLEERYSKRAILESYLNRVYFGDGYYGVEAAAIGYFGKPVANLDAAEAAMLAGLIKGPSLYSPSKNPDAARKRRDLVLEVMRAEGMLGDQEFQSAVSVPVTVQLARGDKTGVADPRHARGAEYFRDAVSRELIHRFGSEAVYTGGLRVYTTLDRDLQRLAESVIASRLRGIGRAGRDPLQGALVAIDPRTGFVKAVVGGRSFAESPYNRAVDARRQPGSAFKPFIYAMALESGYSPGSLLEGLDQPIPSYKGPWLPGGEHETSSTTLRKGLALSSNRAAAHLMQEVGVHRTLDLVQRFGVSSPMPAVPAVALGTGEMTLLELTSAYGVFANRGLWKEPTLIRRVVDRYGREIYTASNTDRRVITEATAYMMTSMMTDVLDYGTAASARAQGFKLQGAGKTGTSQDYSDAWFVGYTPSIVTGVWFGFDKPQPIMNRGFASVVAVPAWARFMTGALHGVKEDWFAMPGSLVKVKICRLSGMLATDRCNEPVYEQPPYDPNNPDVVTASASAPVARQSGVFEDVRPADRVPPPCTMLHGDAGVVTQPLWADPPPTAPGVQRTGGLDNLMSIPPAQSAPIDTTRPVAPPPPFMTEKRAPTPVTTMPATAPAPVPVPAPTPTPTPTPTAPAPAAAAKPDPSAVIIPAATAPAPAPSPKPAEPAQDPVIPGSKVTKEPPSAAPSAAPPAPNAPIIPGTSVERTPPEPPKKKPPVLIPPPQPPGM